MKNKTLNFLCEKTYLEFFFSLTSPKEAEKALEIKTLASRKFSNSHFWNNPFQNKNNKILLEFLA